MGWREWSGVDGGGGVKLFTVLPQNPHENKQTCKQQQTESRLRINCFILSRRLPRSPFMCHGISTLKAY